MQARRVRADMQVRLYNSIGGFILPLPAIVNLLGTKKPPRQASPATPPQEGNCRVQTRCDCSSVSILVISPPQEGNCLVQTRYNHPVKRSLTPLHRRGIPPRQAEPATPPQEGNTTPSSFACHPSTGGEYHPVRRSLPPLHRRGIAGYRRDAIAVVYLY